MLGVKLAWAHQVCSRNLVELTQLWNSGNASIFLQYGNLR